MSSVTDQTTQEQLESLVGKSGILVVVQAFIELCDKRAKHIEVEYQDASEATAWRGLSKALFYATLRAEKIQEGAVSSTRKAVQA